MAFTENKILGISNSHQLLKLGDRDITFGKQSVFGESNEFEALQEHALDKADYFIPLISRAYLDSKYTMQELLFGLKKAGQSICKVIPVFVESMDSDEFKKLSGNLMIINHGNDYAGAFDALVDKIKREDELDYWMDLAYQDWNDKHYHSAEISLQKAIEVGDKDRMASMYMQLGNIRLDEYSYCNDDPSLDASIDAYRKAVEYADECNDESTLISVMMKLGGILKGYSLEEALRCYERALSIASPFNKKIAVECKKAIDSIKKQQQISGQQIDSRLIRISEKMLETIEEAYTLLRDDSSASTVESLRNMYSHLLNYCQVTGISGNIKRQCETRVSYLRNLESFGTEGNYSKILRNLIGQSLPDVENMDVFVSFKSQDLEFAKKVERFLRNNGKRVFMSEEALPNLSRTEFAKMIDEALEKSKHIVIVATDLSYLTTNWVEYEWRTFALEVQEGRKTGEILLLLKDEIAYDKPHFPIRLRDREVVKTSELEKKLLSYLW